VVWTVLDLMLLDLLDVRCIWTVVELMLSFWLYGEVELIPDALWYGMRSCGLVVSTFACTHKQYSGLIMHGTMDYVITA